MRSIDPVGRPSRWRGVEAASASACTVATIERERSISASPYCRRTERSAGGAAAADLKRLREFARLGGVSFQIRDDLLDMEGEKGRPPGSDVLEGKRTLLVVHAARQASAADRRRLYRVLNKPRNATPAADVAWVWQLFRRTGADAWAASKAADLIDLACQHALGLPESAAKYRLIRLARYLGARRH